MVESKNIAISKLQVNKGQIEGLPNNPRLIRDARFNALKKSIEDAPEMLALRELIVFPFGGKYVIVGGNMRFRACKDLGYKEIPCKVLDESTPVEKLREYTIKDNVGFGQDDFDILANEWNEIELSDWGMEVPTFDLEEEEERETATSEESDDEDSEREDEILDLLDDRIYPSDNEYDIPVLMMERQPKNGLILPFNGWGACCRDKKMIGTYHFYVDDYRFEGIWKHPEKVIISGCKAIVEPNLSLFDTTPVAYGLQQIYKKRWIARYYQECGIDVYADLNVAVKFQQYNKLGIPKGYNAFFTRGYDQRTDALDSELAIAKEISGLDAPNLVVYGGGKKVKQFCDKHSLLYAEQFMQSKQQS